MALRSTTNALLRQLPRGVVPRPTLERRLDALRPGGLALIVASAGSGKSVLVGHWCATRPQQRVAALALSHRHGDAVVLAKDLVTAIREAAPEIDPGLSDLVVRGGSALGDLLVDGLRDALGAIPHDVVLVLEDVHALTGPELLSDLGRLLCSLPDHVRAVVTTRRDPPWPVRQLRLRGTLVEVRGADLAFTAGEARALIESVSQRDIADGDVAALLVRTDGWAVGLQLAAISLRQVSDVHAFVESFAGSDRLVAEYLLEEVVEQQRPDLRGFLLQTSVLDWLSVDLCEAVTGVTNARAILSELYARSMFLIPLDRSGERYRYHHLFADLLRYELRVEDPAAAARLHRAAARWLADHGHHEEAIGHLLSAGDRLEAFRLISDVGHRLYERGESATLVSWLSTIEAAEPDGPVAVQVNLLAAQLALDRVGGAAETYRRLVRRPEITLGERTAGNAMYSMLVYRDLDPETVLAIADEVRAAIPLLGPGDVVDFMGIGGRDSAQTIAEYAAAGAHFLRGDTARAGATLEHVLTLPGVRYPVFKVYVLGTLALVRAWTGHSTDALRLADASLATAKDFGITRHPATTHAHLAAGMAHLDRGEVGAATSSLTESRLMVGRRPASVTYLDHQQILEVKLAAVTKGPAAALELFGSPEAAVSQAVLLVCARRALHARLLLALGRRAGAEALLESDEEDSPLVPAAIDLALAAGELRKASGLLDRWQPSADDRRGTVERLLRRFAVSAAENHSSAAEAALAEAAARATADRLYWPFLEFPSALRTLRRQGHGSGLTSDALWGLAVCLDPSLNAQSGLVEQLTDRELEVLSRLPSRSKNEEIAHDLFVSHNTLKTHLRSIYRKLDATERNEAVARATELGLI